MNKKTYKWCEPNDVVKDVRTGIDQVLRSSYSMQVSERDGCLRWVCQCRHDKGTHSYNDICYRCKCNKFEYLNNNNCDLECSIQRKLYEVEMV